MNTAPTRIKGLFKGCAVALLFALAAETGSARAEDWSVWKVVATGGAVVEMVPDNSGASDGQNTNSFRLTVKDLGQRAGIVSGPDGEANIQAGQWYDLSFYASTDGRKTFALTVSLESPDGKMVGARATLPEVGGARAKFHLALYARQTAPKCHMVITMAETGTIQLDGITLVPRDKS